MRSIKLYHPDLETENGTYFIFYEDGTYDMGSDDVTSMGKDHSGWYWSLQEFNDNAVLTFRRRDEATDEWMMFWCHTDNEVAFSWCCDYGQRLLNWLTSIQLLGDEYVIAN